MHHRRSTLALSLYVTLVAAHAADTPEPAPAPAPAAARVADPLAPARMAIESKRWGPALDELKRVNASGNADWNNLMGYALRKQAVPDLDGAQRHYDAALKLDPAHRGALEYSGELALMKGDLATAESRAAVLTRICGGACGELDDLKKAIARYKTNGGKYSY